jgi:hypothetical protein
MLGRRRPAPIPIFTESASRYGAVKREMPGGGVPVDLL